MTKLLALLDLFRKGEAVANPEAWKKGQMTATVLIPLILAAVEVARVFGYAIPLTTDQAGVLAGALVIAVNLILTVTTTEKVGVLPAKNDEDSGARLTESPS